MDDRQAFEVAKLAFEKYFDMHKKQLINLSMEEFARLYTRTFAGALRVVGEERNQIDETKASVLVSTLL